MRFSTSVPLGLSLRTRDSARLVVLLLLLAAALAGLFLLLEYIASLTSAGPRDLTAVTPSAEETLGVPNGVDLIEWLALSVSIALASATLLVVLGWPPRWTSVRPSWSLALGALVAAALVAAGAYLAFSGALSGSVGYDRHLVQRADLDAGNLIVLAAIFVSATIAGLLSWRLLAACLLAWLVAGAAFGLLDSESIDGLLLFPRTELANVPGGFETAVRGVRQGDARGAASPTGQPAETSELQSQVTVLREVPPRDDPVFRVAGASQTRYLRTSTGDTYRDGAWAQLQQTNVQLEENKSVADARQPFADQLHLPLTLPLHEFAQRIVVMPVDGAEALPTGALPASKNLRSVDTRTTYFPFSETLASDDELPRYEMSARVPVFALQQKVNAASVADPAYLQLPDDLPTRVHQLAEQIAGEGSPYLRARRLQVFLQEEYAGSAPGSGRGARPPAAQDPVDWFLFDHRVGSSSNFSSAFVLLARAADVPARAVSGWVVATQAETQTVYRRQAHQWAEIALDGVGWVTVDPFPRDAFTDSDVDHAWVSALGEMATSAEREVREAASDLWSDSDDPEARLRLFGAIDQSLDPNAKTAAQAVLSALVLDRLSETLLTHVSARSRAAAAFGLEVAASPEALGALLEALSVDADAQVRVSAADALAIVGKDSAEEALLSGLSADESAAVRAASARALGALKTAWTATRMLSALSSDPSPAVRSDVAQSLGEIRDSATLLALIEARADDASGVVRAAAGEALGEWEFVELREILESGAEPLLRAATAQLMGEGRFAEAIVPLGTALSDSAAQVREAARSALDAIGEVRWLENGGGAMVFQGDLAFLPFVTAEHYDIAPGTPVFRVRGSRHTSLLRVAVGDIYEEGKWTPAEQEALPAGVAGIGFRAKDIRPSPVNEAGNRDNISLSSIGAAHIILAGPVPTSLHAESFSAPVTYLVPSHTVFARGPYASYDWDAVVYEHPPGQLHAAGAWAVGDGSEYLQLPSETWVGRARALATEITAGLRTAYGRAEAIERYLIEEYEYLPPGASNTPTDPDQDPIAEFLFDTRRGTAGQFSSAFVMLARSVGIPARVVSGWAVAPTSISQVVFTNQAHQWAEVPFRDIGWVAFDPAPQGAPSRVSEDLVTPFETVGADATKLEFGGAVIEYEDEAFMIPATTVSQSEAPTRKPLYELSGAAHTGYLRTAVGDEYEDGEWAQRNQADIQYTAGSDIPGELQKLQDSLTSRPNAASTDGLASLAPFGVSQEPVRLATDRIEVLPAEGSEELPFGAMPASLDAQQIDVDGVFQPFSATFSSGTAEAGYSWTTSVPVFTLDQYEAAAAASDAPALTQLPEDLPERVRELALAITGGEASAYAKAEALEQYLRDNYDYAFAENGLASAPPAGRDPVDWFLFDSREGTAGQFSSAFAILARSVGIPTRVVSGFVVSPTAAPQTVHTDQAHQWAEVALEGIGWVRFDPTPAGGAPSRVPGHSPAVRVVEDADIVEEDAGVRVDTTTNITEAPVEARRMTPFAVAGTVLTEDGEGVSGMTVEIYINETKEHGGTKIGVTTTSAGRFKADARLPLNMEVGDYQLLARAVGNDQFNESWSDPDIKVYSGNRIELTGPSEVEVNAAAVFEGIVTDDSGSGVAQREIEATFDGSIVQTVLTDQDGRFTFSEAFSELGQHWVVVVLREEEYLLDNTARLSFEVVMPTEFALYAPDAVSIGEDLLVTGEVREADGPPLRGGQVELTIESPERRDVVIVDVGDDGQFEHSISTSELSGRYTLTGRFSGAEFIRPASAEVAFWALRPTVLRLDGPAVAQDGERFMITGTLSEIDGRPVPSAAVRILTEEPFSVTTDAAGRFTGEVQATFDPGAAIDPQESVMRVEAAFDWTQGLDSSGAALTVAVGIPWILVETPKPAIRGSEVMLRGAVLLGASIPLAGVEIAVGGARFSTSDAGAFTYAYPVSGEEALGAGEAVIAAPALGVSAAVRLEIKSATSLIVTPVDKVSPGEATTIQVALLDDTGTGIPGAVLRSSQGVNTTADEFGIATLELVVPEPEELPGSRVQFTYGGNDLNAPISISYFWEGAITPGGAEWIVWTGLSILIAVLLAGGYVGRRYSVIPLMGLARFRRAPTALLTPPSSVDEIESSGEAEAAESAIEPEDAEVEVILERHPVQLQIAFRRHAEDLADIWGVGEEVPTTVSVTDEGQPLAGVMVEVSVSDGVRSELTVGQDGAGSFSWSNALPGEYVVSAEFVSDDDVVLTESRSARVVEFREEIVRLYGVFLHWASQRGGGVSELSTPREAAELLMTHGPAIPQRDLDEVISRFEEADYSEHEILRLQYEAMYRAMNAVMAADQ